MNMDYKSWPTDELHKLKETKIREKLILIDELWDLEIDPETLNGLKILASQKILDFAKNKETIESIEQAIKERQG